MRHVVHNRRNRPNWDAISYTGYHVLCSSQRIEQHVGALGQPFIAPQRLQHIVFRLADLIVIEDEPLRAYPDIAHVVSIVLACAQVHHHAHQLVQPFLLLVLGVVGFDLQLEGEGHLPVQLGDAFLILIVFEPAQMDREEVRQRPDHTPLLRLHQLPTTITLELVSSEQLLRFAVVAYTVIQRDVRLRQDETEVHFLLLTFRDFISWLVLVLQTEHSVRVTRFEKNYYSRAVTFFLSFPLSWSFIEFISQI